MNEECKAFYESSYQANGFGAQRRYPNEELLRFMGRTFFSLTTEQRKDVRILETGCGSGANLWAIAREGFDTFGIDLSSEGIGLCHEMLKAWGCSAQLTIGDMTTLPYEQRYFDAVVDVFASYCLPEKDFPLYLNEVARILKPGGAFFSYALSKESDVFKEATAAEKIDPSTLNGIHRPTAPYYGNFYPVRFVTPEEYETLLHEAGHGGFTLTHNEVVGRTYRGREEYFEYVVIHAIKK